MGAVVLGLHEGGQRGIVVFAQQELFVGDLLIKFLVVLGIHQLLDFIHWSVFIINMP